MKRIAFLFVAVALCGTGFWFAQESGAEARSGMCYVKSGDMMEINHPDIFKWKWGRGLRYGDGPDTTPITPQTGDGGDDLGRGDEPAEWTPLPEKVVYFDYDKSVLKPAGKAAIQNNVQFLKEKPGARVLIEGHCDERGTNEYNLALGERRADAVAGYLETLGVRSGRISTRSWGEEKPLDTGRTEEAYQLNRRVEFYAIPLRSGID